MHEKDVKLTKVYFVIVDLLLLLLLLLEQA